MRLGLVVSFYLWIIHILLNPNNIIIITVLLVVHLRTQSTASASFLTIQTPPVLYIYQTSVNLLYLPYSNEFYEIDRHHLQKTTFSALHSRGAGVLSRFDFLVNFKFSTQRKTHVRVGCNEELLSNNISRLWIKPSDLHLIIAVHWKFAKLARDFSHFIIMINNSEDVQQTTSRMSLRLSSFKQFLRLKWNSYTIELFWWRHCF